jgi:hypothetical protein
MKLLTGLLKIGLSPLKGIAEVVDDLSGNNSDAEQGLSVLTLGTSSVIKGTVKSIKRGVDDILD